MSDTEAEDSEKRREKLNQKLLEACESGDHEAVSRLLDEGADITTKNSNGDTGLHLGVCRGHEQVVMTLINHGIDVNISDIKWTPLMEAAQAGQLKMVQILLDHGAKVNTKSDDGGVTALNKATIGNFPDIVSLLLQHGADETIADNGGQIAIQRAEEQGYDEVIKVFCEAWKKKGSSLHVELLTAAKEGRGRLVLGLITAGADIQTRDERGETGLDLAVRGGHKEVAEMFLDYGISGYNKEKCLEECDKNRKRNEELLSAARSGDNDSVNKLLDEGAEITSKNRNGDTGLHLSAEQGHHTVVKTFLGRGINVSIRGCNQWTALINAANYGHLTSLKLLLDADADPDLKAATVNTALKFAARNSYPEIVSELLRRGADKNIEEDGKTAQQSAEGKGNQDVVKIFEVFSNKENINTEMLTAAKEGRGRLVLCLITAGADIQTRDERGETGLDLAVRWGHREAAEVFLDYGISGYNKEKCLKECEMNRKRNEELLSAAMSGEIDSVIKLLDEGAEITSKDSNGDTGLHLSAEQGHHTVLKTFLERGINVNIRGKYQWTALIKAANYGHLTSLKILLDADADSDLKDRDGETALILASKKIYPEIVSELLRREADEKIEYDGKTAQQSAEEKGNQDVVKMFEVFSNKENINTEMLTAAKEGRGRLVLSLIIAGADIQTRHDDGDTALHLGAARGHESVVRTLITQGMDVNSRGQHNATPLMCAAGSGHLTVAKILMKNNAQLNLQDRDGWTALRWGLSYTSVVMELIEQGADPDIEVKNNKTALQVAQGMGEHDCVLLLDRGQIQADDERGARAVLAAAEAGCPKVLSELLRRGASRDSETNAMGENAPQVVAKYPQIIREEHRKYLEDVEKKNEMKPEETLEKVVMDAEKKSRKMAKMFLSKSLVKHDLRSVTNKMQEVVHFSSQSHFNEKTFGDDEKFYLKVDVDNETLMESILELNLLKEREDTIDVMKKVDAERYTDRGNAAARIKRQVKKAVPSSIGLRECLRSIDQKFPWGRSKVKTMVTLSFITQVCMGLSFYSADVYTDVIFAMNMYAQSNRNFRAEFVQCHNKFNEEFDQTIETCKMSFDKQECMKSISVIQKRADDCFEDERRFENPNDWRIAEVVCAIHIGLPMLTGLVVWAILLVQENCFRGILYSLSKLPLPFVTKIFRFWYDKEMFEILADPGRYNLFLTLNF